MNSPLEELLEWESVSLSHSFIISVTALGLLSCSHSGEFGSVGESCVKDVLIISSAGPANYYIALFCSNLLFVASVLIKTDFKKC